MQTLSQAEFLALTFALAVAGLAAVIVLARSHAPLADAMARRVKRTIAMLQDDTATHP